MSIQFENYLKIILYQSRLCASSFKIDSYSLSFSVFSLSSETEAINLPDITFGEKCFHFEMSKYPFPKVIEITAKSKSMYLIKKVICKITIPFSVAKCTHQRQWYFLKSDDNENILKVLIAFYCERSPMKISSQCYHSDLSYDFIMPLSSLRYYHIRDKEKRLSIDRERGREWIHERDSERNGNMTSKYPSKINLTFSRSNSIELNRNFKTKLIVLNELQNEYEDKEMKMSEKIKMNEKNSKLFLTMIKNKLNSVNASQEQINNDIELIKEKEQVLKQNKLLLLKKKKQFESSKRELNLRERRYNKSSSEFVSNHKKYNIDYDTLSIQTEIDEFDKKAFCDINLINNSSIYLMPKERFDLSGSMKNKIVNMNTTVKKEKAQKTFIKGKPKSKHIIRADSSSNLKDSQMKHLNSTNFTSNCSDMYYSVINNNSNNNTIPIESIQNVNGNTSNSSKHLTSKMSMNINIKKNKKESKDSKLIDSIDSHTQKSFYKKAKKPVRDFDNIKVIKIKARKCFPSKTKNKNYIYLRSNNSINNSHNNHYNATARKHTTSIKSIDKCQTISSLKESSSSQNFLVQSSTQIEKIK